MKRVLFMGDTHCGHQAGLTPPGWQNEGWLKLSTKAADLYRAQQQCWNFYVDQIKRWGPFHVVVFNGDAIDGRGHRSGGVELMTTRQEDQCEMAVYAIRKAISKETERVIMTYGTDYHVGDSEDYENQIAKDLDAAIADVQHIQVEEVKFNLRHHLGSSGVPTSRNGAINREWVWNLIKANRNEEAKAHVIIRSHVHYFEYSGNRDRLGLSLPALQAPHTRYGKRRCSGTVDYGFAVFECRGAEYTWFPVIATKKEIPSQMVKLIHIK